MKRKAVSISTNSVEADGVIRESKKLAIELYESPVVTDQRDHANCESKKQDDDNKMAIVLHEPPVVALPLDHVKKMKRRARRPREKIDDGPKPSPGIPTRLKDMIEKMGGTEWRLIIQKGLRPTDLSINHSRLSMPSTEWDFLSAEELMMFENGNNVRVPMIDTKMKVWECVSVRRWKMKKVMFVIADVWNKLAAENELMVKDVVQIWCFKFIQTGRHGLAMVKIGPASTDISSTGSSTSTSTSSSTASNTRMITESDAIGSERIRQEGLSTQVAITKSALPNISSDEIDLTLRLNNTRTISSCAARTPQVPTPNDHSCKVAEASSSTTHSHSSNSADNNGSGNYREGLVTYLNYSPIVPDSTGSETARHGGLSAQVAITESALPNTSSDEIDLTLRL